MMTSNKPQTELSIDQLKLLLEKEKQARLRAEEAAQHKAAELEKERTHHQDFTAALEKKTAEIESARDEAVAHAEARSQFLANMSHEIRTPMNGVIGMLEVLRYCNDEDKRIKLINTAVESGAMLVSIINNILEFSKLNTVDLVLSEVDFDPTKTIESIIQNFATNAHIKGLDLVTAIDPNLPRLIQGDATRLKQVVGNLINNAIKFTEFGEVTVGAHLVETGAIRIFVSDTGIGLSEDQTKNIFKAFSQADASTTRNFGGTGLGLSISAKIVRHFDTRIEIYSKPNEGSTFLFDIDFPIIEERTTVDDYADKLKDTVIVLVSPSPARTTFFSRFMSLITCHQYISIPSLTEFGETTTQSNRKHIVLLDHDNMEDLNLSINEISNISVDYLKVINISRYQDTDQVSDEFHDHITKPITHTEVFEKLTGIISDTHDEIETSIQDFDFTGKNILVIDDNYVNLQVAKEIFESVGFRVDFGTSGMDAIEMVQKLDVDLVIMDIQMPVMDGLTATQRIRALGGQYESLPIIAMTAHAMHDDKNKSLAAGMNDHLTKPIEPNIIFPVVAKHLQIDMSPTETNTLSATSKSQYPDIKGFDIQTTMERLRGNWTLLKKLILSFADNNAQSANKVREFLADENYIEAQRIVHQLKGSGANLGANQLANCAAKIEQIIKTGETDIPEELLCQLAQELDIVSEAKAQLLDESSDSNLDLKHGANNGDVLSLCKSIAEHASQDLSQTMQSIESLKKACQNDTHKQLVNDITNAFDQFDTQRVTELANAFISGE